MKPGFLKSSTAMVLVASLAAAPAPGFAQTASGDATAQGEEDAQAELLRQQLEADAQAEAEASGDAGEEADADTSGDTAAGSDAEATAQEPAPDPEAAAPQEDAAQAPAAEADAAQAPAAEADAAQAPAPEAEAPESEADAAQEADPAAEAAQRTESAEPSSDEPDPAEAGADVENDAADSADATAPEVEPAQLAEEPAADAAQGDAESAEAGTETMPDAAPADTAAETADPGTMDADTATGGVSAAAGTGDQDTGDEAAAGTADAPEEEAADSDAATASSASDPMEATEGETLEERMNALGNDGQVPDEATRGDAADDAETDAETAQDAPAEDAAPMESDEQAAVEAEAESNSAAALAAASEGEGGEGEPEVVEETVTEETSRSSSEEFSTDLRSALQQGEPAARKKDDDDDDNDGLSNFEKAAILGIGAVAVGSLLRRNETVAANTGDRIVAERDGQYRIIKNDDALLRQPGSQIRTYNYSDGSTRTVVTREDGTEVETVRANDGRVLRRTRTLADGQTAVLFDDTRQSQSVDVSQLPQISTRRSLDYRGVGADELAETLAAAQAANVNRTFSLSQIRNIDAVRQLVPEINVDSVNFETNSAVIRPQEAEALSALGNAMRRLIERNPGEVFLVEGHTDAQGPAGYNLALSDRRAESVALALTEYFDVPPENLVVQGYGESDLVVDSQGAERANRRAAVRRITPLLEGSDT